MLFCLDDAAHSFERIFCDGEVMKKKALVVEGGGMRGVFSAGVLDAFHELAFDPFDLYLGVSSGACNLASFAARQHRRNLRNYIGPMHRRDFLSVRRFLRGKHYIDLDWLWELWRREDPLDIPTAEKHLDGRQMLFVCTSFDTGRAAYLSPKGQDWYQIQKASSALPLMYRTPVMIDGAGYVDGGVADAIPVREAYERGARSIVVVRSRPISYVKKLSSEARLLRWLFRKNPPLLQALERREETYMDSIEFIRRPPRDAQIVEITPTGLQKTSRTTQELESLEHDYHMGLCLGGIFAAHRGRRL